jgi:hypothetical protein
VSSGGAFGGAGGSAAGGTGAGIIPEVPGSLSVGPMKEAMPQIAGRKSGNAVITAVGLADPQDARFAKNGLQVEPQLWADARRQLIEKAVALYIDPSSINANYALLRDKLFSRSDEYISTVLEQQQPQSSRYGLLLGTIRASVRIHDVHRALNEISREERVEFIRNNGNPRIAVDVRVQGDLADQVLEPQRSALAENVLMDRIRSFGFVAVDAATAQPAPDFLLSGEVRLKHLSATLPASGLTIEKVALTSWTIRAVDPNTGEEVYLNTTIPQRRSWATEDLALREIGRLIGSQFSREFFLHTAGPPAFQGAARRRRPIARFGSNRGSAHPERESVRLGGRRRSHRYRCSRRPRCCPRACCRRIAEPPQSKVGTGVFCRDERQRHRAVDRLQPCLRESCCVGAVGRFATGGAD